MIKNRIFFIIKTGFKLELLSTETTKLSESLTKDVDKDKDGDVPKLESVEVVLVHCNLVNTTIRKHLKYYLFLYLINNLVS